MTITNGYLADAFDVRNVKIYNGTLFMRGCSFEEIPIHIDNISGETRVYLYLKARRPGFIPVPVHRHPTHWHSFGRPAASIYDDDPYRNEITGTSMSGDQSWADPDYTGSSGFDGFYGRPVPWTTINTSFLKRSNTFSRWDTVFFKSEF